MEVLGRVKVKAGISQGVGLKWGGASMRGLGVLHSSCVNLIRYGENEAEGQQKSVSLRHNASVLNPVTHKSPQNCTAHIITYPLPVFNPCLYSSSRKDLFVSVLKDERERLDNKIR